MHKFYKILAISYLLICINPVFGQEERSKSTYNFQLFPYAIAGTGVSTFYNNTKAIAEPDSSSPFFGQDAHYRYNQPQYKDNGDGTVSDLVTGLMWQKSLSNKKYTYAEALENANQFNLGAYSDWRLPTIKELYSLIMFYGEDPIAFRGFNTDQIQPFINTSYFNFRYGDMKKGERIIDAQYVSSTKYVSTTMHGNPTVFGVNFADGRIKGYPISSPHGEKTFEVLYVRGNENYGNNKFVDNGDGTILDKATGLMWAQSDSKQGMNWQEALEWVQRKNKENYLGYNDWRLPDAKELQSIVDYSRSPATTNSPAIDPLFECSGIKDANNNADYPFYWTSTTHARSNGSGNSAVYISFGRALGWLRGHHNHQPFLTDVHGAGAQRSDPKAGNPKDYPYGFGPQGDVRRIYNYVRCVRSTF